LSLHALLKLEIAGFLTGAVDLESLEIRTDTPLNITYHVRLYSDNLCTGSPEELHFETNGRLDLQAILTPETTRAVITPEYLGGSAPTFLHEIDLSLKEIEEIRSFDTTRGLQSINAGTAVTLVLDDNVEGSSSQGFVQTGIQFGQSELEGRFGYFMPSVANRAFNRIVSLGHATDRFSHERGPIELTQLARQIIIPDDLPPELTITAPAEGVVVVPQQNILLEADFSDNTETLESLKLIENRQTDIALFGVNYSQTSFAIPYVVPIDYSAGELELTLLAEDRNGNIVEQSIRLPVDQNEKPLLDLKGFHSYLTSQGYKKSYTEPQRLNYGEFWVRSGETFRIDTEISDDAGLQSFVINRLAADGSIAQQVFAVDYTTTCPVRPVVHDLVEAEIQFDRAEPTEFEEVVTDTYGNQERRRFLIHPLVNVVPEVRITSPAQGQQIAAGTFQIKVGVVASDDRLLTDASIQVFANGVPLSVTSRSIIEDIAGGDVAVSQAFASIYDSFEQNYDIETADESCNIQHNPVNARIVCGVDLHQHILAFNNIVTTFRKAYDHYRWLILYNFNDQWRLDCHVLIRIIMLHPIGIDSLDIQRYLVVVWVLPIKTRHRHHEIVG
ncbi:MAG: hypothetical protein ABW119_22400, partial [Candidatus Thiodiazotropha lotti]